MDCPRCEAELVAVENEKGSLSCCPECSGVWTDVSELNRLLLRHNLPVLEKLGGQVNPDDSLGLCPDCQIDLVAIEGGEKRSMAYDTCEHCGGIFVDTEGEAAFETFDEAVEAIIGFYRRFKPETAGK
ncbi:MAG: zf-TFIIB domain-containing protein [Myxococcales bacterium]|jgi:Zn-finger nucleic acid-binding protein|nr:zf-TFIIB domain-containing protein [Myxococcales bacterium]